MEHRKIFSCKFGIVLREQVFLRLQELVFHQRQHLGNGDEGRRALLF